MEISLPWVHLQLIPRHIRIPGTEKGKALAKIGTNKPQPALNMMLTSAKNSGNVVKKSWEPYKQVQHRHTCIMGMLCHAA
jgi:hypothetical protein